MGRRASAKSAAKAKAPEVPEPRDEEEDLDALWNDGAAPIESKEADAGSSSEEDSYFLEDEQPAVGASGRAEARGLTSEDDEQHGDSDDQQGASKIKLPSAAATFEEVDGPPAFLNPEANRKVASGPHWPGLQTTASTPATEKKAWDISKMAPKLKGEAAPEDQAVIKGSAVQYRDGSSGQQPVSAAAIAMLGGTAKVDRGKATQAMPVDDFLDKGAGGAQLPRKRQDRKERERDKRMKGQSSHAAWKSEAEMVLRQQYD